MQRQRELLIVEFEKKLGVGIRGKTVRRIYY